MWHGAVPWRRRLDPAQADDAGIEGLEPGALVCALTVVSGALAALERQAVARGVPFRVAGRDLACPLQLAYSTPATLGADRWVAALAAHRLYGAAVVVDCGTALTVDLVTGDGVFRGGAIAPGPYTMVQALACQAPALPVADLSTPVGLPATDTKASVDGGVGVGFAGMVDGLIDRVLEGAGVAVDALVLTGGGADVYLRFGRRPSHLHPDLVHQGLRWLSATDPSSC
jgi:type III pantothenate kinase